MPPSPGMNSASVFVTSALEKLASSKEGRRVPQLKQTAEKALALLVSFTKPDALRCGDHMTPSDLQVLLEPLELACSTRNVVLLTTSIDCIAKLISYGCFVTASSPASIQQELNEKNSNLYPGEIPHSLSDKKEVPVDSRLGLTATGDLKMVDVAIEIVCKCYGGEATDERVHLQIVKALLSAITASDLHVHGSSLIKAVRCTWNIYLTSKTPQITTVAQGALNQIVNLVFMRAKTHSIDVNFTTTHGLNQIKHRVPPSINVSLASIHTANLHPLPPSPSGCQSDSSGSDLKSTGDVESSIQQHDKEDIFPPSVSCGAITSIDPTINTPKISPGSTSDHSVTNLDLRNEQDVIDAFLVIRALCKLSTKTVNENSTASHIKSTSINSRVLSLQFIGLALDHYFSIFHMPIGSSSPESSNVSQISSPPLSENIKRGDPSKFGLSQGHTALIELVKSFLSLAVASALASPVLNIYIVALKIFSTLTLRLRSYLKRELEIIFSEVLLTVLEIKSAASAQKIAILQTLESLTVQSHIFVEFYINYDCNTDAQDNIYERLIGIISRLLTAPPNILDARSSHDASVISNNPATSGRVFSSADLPRAALECLSKIICSLSEWVTFTRSISVVDSNSSQHNGGVDDPEELEVCKQKKTVVSEAIMAFNKKPKKGVKILFDQKIIENDPTALASWLMTTEGLNKISIGEFLGDCDELSMAVMHSFVDLLDFKGLQFVEALRFFFQHFRLPGESQKIDRMLLKFADRFYSCNKEELPVVFSNAEAAYVLAYSVTILNTDLHNHQVKNRMTKTEFIRNNRGINDGKDLPEDFLNTVYDIINMNEIKLKDDPLAVMRKETNQISVVSASKRMRREAFASALDEILQKLEPLFDKKQRSTPTWIVATHSDHVRPMIELVWMAVFVALSTSMQQFDEDSMVASTLLGFKHLVYLSCIFDLDLQRSTLITTLKNFTMLSNVIQMREKNFSSIKTLLEVALQNGDRLRGGWLDVLKCVSQLEKVQVIGQNKQSHDAAMMLQETSSQSLLVMIDRIFVNSAKLDGAGLVDFVEALCTVSQEEIPGNYSLKKLVEISDYNMQRIRVEWVNMWNVLGAHFNRVGCHENEHVAFFALDSLRQMAMKFLQKEELSNFKFQREFLRPFEYVVENNMSLVIREMVLRCLQQMVQAKSGVLRSGWKSILSILGMIAARETTISLFNFAFDNTRVIVSMHSQILLKQGYYADMMEVLLAFTVSRASQKISLQAIDLMQKAGLVLADVASVNSIDEQLCYNFLKCLQSAVNGSELEVRTRAHRNMFSFLKSHGAKLSKAFWQRVATEILFPLFDPIASTSMILLKDEEMGMWLSTTMTHALRQFLDLFVIYFRFLSELLPRVLDLLRACIIQDNEMLAKLGTSCLLQLIRDVCALLNDDEWALICDGCSLLFLETTANELLERDLLDKTQADQNERRFQQILGSCVRQLLLIQTVVEFTAVEEVYRKMKSRFLLQLVDDIKKSYYFSRKFNEDTELRNGLCSIGFTKHVPNLLQQETSSATCILYLLYSLYSDTNGEKGDVLDIVRKDVIEFSKHVLTVYCEMESDEHKRNSGAWKPVIGSILNGIQQLTDTEFEYCSRILYFLLIEILIHPISTDLRNSLRKILQRIGNLRKNELTTNKIESTKTME